MDKDELAVLKVLVEKELENVSKEGRKIFISNSPFMNRLAKDDDLTFLKSEVAYKKFLQELLQKL